MRRDTESWTRMMQRLSIHLCLTLGALLLSFAAPALARAELGPFSADENPWIVALWQ